jgi:hypothetical protein
MEGTELMTVSVAVVNRDINGIQTNRPARAAVKRR